MTKTDIIAEVEKRLGPLDERAKRAVEMAMELMEQLPTTKPEPQWQGENPSFDEMTKLTEEERLRIMDKLATVNHGWLEWKQVELGAHWMLVADGKVLMHGPTLDNYPSDEEVEELCHRTGKMLLLYTAPLLIEERTPWHPTIYPADFYPTLPVTFEGRGRSVEIIADFDTGAADTYVDAAMLQNQGIIRITPATPWRRESHLGQDFWFTVKRVEVVLTGVDGFRHSTVLNVLCIRAWAQSPFVSVNPNRTALVGRDLCLRLQPQVTLNFAQHQTTVHW